MAFLLGSTRRRWLLVGVIIAAFGIAAVIYAVERRSSTPVSPFAQAPAGSSVTFAVTPQTKDVPADTLQRFATPIGSVYQFTPSGRADGAIVTFPVTPSDLDAIDGYQPTPVNLFLAIYEPGLKMWVPMATQYHADTRTLTAMPAHFSGIRKYTMNGLERIGSTLASAGSKIVKGAKTSDSYVANAFTTGVMGLEQQIVDSASDLYDELRGSHQVTAPCGAADHSYAIAAASDNDKFPGCVHASGSDQLLELENHWSLPFGLKAPTDAHPQTPFSRYDDLADMIAGVYYKSLNGTYLPAKNYGTASLTPPLTTSSSWTASLVFDTFAFAVSTILAAVGILPGEQEFTEETLAFKQDTLPVLDEDGPTTVHDFFLDWEQGETKTIKGLNTDVLAVSKLDEAVECVQAQYAAAGTVLSNPTSLSDALDAAAKVALKCAGAVVNGCSPLGVTGCGGVTRGFTVVCGLSRL